MTIKKCRSLRTKGKNQKGRYPLSITLRKYALNDSVVLKFRCGDYKRCPHRIFEGKVGIITKVNSQSHTYDVLLRERKNAKIKKINTSALHLSPIATKIIL